MHLGPDFTSHFNFRMLDGCPALTELSLTMFGPDAPPEGHTVLESDLCSSHTESGYISCPNLARVSLCGIWVLSPQVLRVLFSHVIANVTELSAYGWPGYALKEWVEAVRLLKRPIHTTLRTPRPTENEMEVGLKLHVVGAAGGFVEDQPPLLRFNGFHYYTFQEGPLVP